MANILYRGQSVPSTVNTAGAKNAALSNTEIDQNFFALNRDKLELNGYTAGDVFYANASGSITRLAKGTNGQALKLSAGYPSWGAIDWTEVTNKPTTGLSLTLDDSTDQTQYLSMSTGTTGSWSSAYVASSLYFNPSTGTLNSTNFNSLSDIRFKTDIEKISGALDKIKQLSGYTFTLIEQNVKSTGLIAQEVKEVLPEAIAGSDDRLTVSYGNMMGLIVEAIKELDKKLENIQSQLLINK